MNFPLFIQGVPAIDMPASPMQYPMLNFLPAIQVLKSNQKQPAESKSGVSKKDDANIEATIGQSQHWQDKYDRAVSKANKILSYKGEEAINDPYYKQVMSEISALESPGIKQTLKENLSNLNRYKANTKDKGTFINLEEGFKTGVFTTNNYWSNYLDHAQTEDVGTKDANARSWLSNFNWNPTQWGYDDAAAQIKENNKTGTSEYNYKNGYSQLDEFVKGDMAGLLKVHNTVVRQYKSNTNKFGEKNMVNGEVVTGKGPDGKPLPVEPGQLDYALEENQRQALQNFNLTSKINSGLFQDFAQRTGGYIPSSSPEMSNELHAFRNRLDIGLTPEQIEKMNSTLDGYYYKEGTVIDGVDVSGQLNEDAMNSDFRAHANSILAKEYGIAAIEVKREETDNDWTFYNMNDEQSRAWYSKQEAAMFAAGAQQSQTTITATEDQGYTEDDLLKLMGGGKEDQTFLGSMIETMQNMLGFGESDGNIVDIATKSDNVSPFEVQIKSDGTKGFVPKNVEDWDSEAMRYKLYKDTKDKNPSWTDKDINEAVDNKMIKLTALHSNALKQRYSQSGLGEGRLETTQLEWSPQQASQDFINVLENAFFGKAANGDKYGKTAKEALKNIDVQIGETVTEGGSLFGDIPILSISNNLKLKAVSLAKNCGVVTKKEITIGGKKIPPGNFVHMNTFDGLSPEKINELVSSGSIFTGSGYWIKTDNKWVDGQKPDRSVVYPMGRNSKSILDAVNIDVENNPQAVTDAASQYYSTITFGGDKASVIKQLTGKTYKAEVPRYSLSTEGSQAYNVAQEKYSKSFVEDDLGVYQHLDEFEKKMRYDKKQKLDIVKYADNLGLKGKNREDFLKDAQNKTGSAVISLAGKYYGQQAGKGNYDWNITPVMADKPIIVNGEPTQGFKNTVGWNETKKEGWLWDTNHKVTFNADVNVTGGLYNGSNVTRAQAIEGQKVYQKANVIPKTKKKDDLVLPNINPR